MRTGDAKLNEMGPPPDTMGRRTSVELYEVGADFRAYDAPRSRGGAGAAPAAPSAPSRHRHHRCRGGLHPEGDAPPLSSGPHAPAPLGPVGHHAGGQSLAAKHPPPPAAGPVVMWASRRAVQGPM